jgi:hypothetical protein
MGVVGWGTGQRASSFLTHGLWFRCAPYSLFLRASYRARSRWLLANAIVRYVLEASRTSSDSYFTQYRQYILLERREIEKFNMTLFENVSFDPSSSGESISNSLTGMIDNTTWTQQVATRTFMRRNLVSAESFIPSQISSHTLLTRAYPKRDAQRRRLLRVLQLVSHSSRSTRSSTCRWRTLSSGRSSRMRSPRYETRCMQSTNLVVFEGKG